MENAWLDAGLGMLIGVVATVLLVVAIGFLYLPTIGTHWMVALGITTLVNIAASLAVGRRFPVFAMAVASSATVAVLLWWTVFSYYGTEFW